MVIHFAWHVLTNEGKWRVSNFSSFATPTGWRYHPCCGVSSTGHLFPLYQKWTNCSHADQIYILCIPELSYSSNLLSGKKMSLTSCTFYHKYTNHTHLLLHTPCIYYSVHIQLKTKGDDWALVYHQHTWRNCIHSWLPKRWCYLILKLQLWIVSVLFVVNDSKLLLLSGGAMTSCNSACCKYDHGI